MSTTHPKPARNKFPITVKQGSASAVIYRTPTTVNGTVYIQYTLSYYHGSRRVRRKFSSFDDAHREAQIAVRAIASGEAAVLTLSADDRASYIKALELIAEAEKPLVVVVSEYMEARRILPAQTSLVEACRDYARRNGEVKCIQTLKELVPTYLASLEKNNRSLRHIQTQKSRLAKFAEAFNCSPSDIRRDAIEAYLDSLGVAPRTRVNEITAITTFFNWMIKLKYAPKDLHEEIHAVQRPKSPESEIVILTPEEMRELLVAAPKELLPYVVFGGFTGLRPSELLRMTWEDITPCGGYVAVKAKKGTAARRTVPIAKAAKKWLSGIQNRTGPISPFKRSESIIKALTNSVSSQRKTQNTGKFEWKDNALRHSFGTYRTAATQNVSQTSLEMGNSVETIQKYYNHVVTKKEGLRFFSISPNDATL
jgi:integrase